MFTTVNEVQRLTGITVTQGTLIQAQVMIEAVAGRPEPEIEGARDAYLMGVAVAYQAAYIHENADTVFEQMGASSLGQGNSYIKFKDGSDAPFISPLAEMTMRGLSWKKTNSVHTGPMFNTRTRYIWEAD